MAVITYSCKPHAPGLPWRYSFLVGCMVFGGLLRPVLAQNLQNNLHFLLEQTNGMEGPKAEIHLAADGKEQTHTIPTARSLVTDQGFAGSMRLRVINDSLAFQNGIFLFPAFDLLRIVVQAAGDQPDTIFTGLAHRGSHPKTYRNVFIEEVSWLRMGRRNQLSFSLASNDTLDLFLNFSHMTDMKLVSQIEWWPEESVRLAERRLGYKWLFQALLCGVLMFIIGYQALLFFLNNARIHLVYSLYVAALLIQSADYSGIMATILLDGMPLLRGSIKLTADFGVAFFYLFFWITILQAETRFPFWNRIIRGMMLGLVLGWIGGVIFLHVSYQFYAAIHFAVFYILTLTLPIVLSFPRLIRENDRVINLLLIGFNFLFFANLINTIFIAVGVDSVYAIGGYLDRFNFYQIGGFIEVCWFMAIINYQQQNTLRSSFKLQAERQAQTEFLKQLNHELRTPLALILGPLELLKKEQLSPTGRRNVAMLRSYTERLSHLIHQMLNLASIKGAPAEVVSPKGLDIAEFLEERKAYFLPIAQAKAISLHLDHPISAARAHVDPEKMRVIMDNLLHNAIKFTPAEGSIHINWYREGREAGIMVADTGYGIPATQLDRIFEPYHRLHQPVNVQSPGTGVGLSLVKNLLEEVAGRIHVESFEGQGSTFTIHIPLELTAKP